MKFLRDREKRETAMQPAQAEDSVSQSAPITRLQKAIDRRRHNYRSSNVISYLAVLAEFATIPLVIHSVLVATGTSFPKFPFIWAISYFLLASVALSYTWRGKKELEWAIMALPDRTDLQAIGPLIDVVIFYGPSNAIGTMGSDYKAYQAAVEALTHLLPRLAVEDQDSSLISVQQCRQLPRVLQRAVNPRSRRRYNVPFAVAILKALEQIGDGSAIPIVERLAQTKPQNEDQSLLQAAASACLVRLRERSQDVEQQNSLLRASSAVPTDTLLRAAIGTSNTDSIQLLRAGQEDSR